MITDEIRRLIREEQARQANRFIEAPDLDAYLDKLDTHAEILSVTHGARCRGFVAYYCNDQATRQAFITLVLVAPDARGTGLGKALVLGVIEVCRRRGFTTCRLEVRDDNTAACAMYRSLGFAAAGQRGAAQIMERKI
jgi:ribosomal protein S18 acetylase RimI-like enzyme